VKQTIVRLSGADGLVKRQIEIDDDDATTFAIAEAVVALAANGWSMSVGDVIEVVKEDTKQ
jgi:hypothetical protein